MISLRRFSFEVLGLLAFVVLVLILSASAPRTRTARLDIINGRTHVIEKFFGMTFRDEIVDTDFSRLVVQHKLEDMPVWVKVTHNSLGYFGGFRSCSLMRSGQLAGDYQTFASMVYPHLSIDAPTTYILEIRRLAQIDYGAGVHDLITSITMQEDWPAK